MQRPRIFSPSTLAAGLMGTLALAAPVWAQPAALGLETEVETRPGGIYAQCPAVAGREDGGFLVSWLRIVPGAKNEILARAGDPGGALEPLRVLDGTGDATTSPLLAPTEDGYTALWHRSLVEPNRFPHLTRELDVDGAPVGEPLDLARGGIELTPRPGGGTVSLWKSGANLNLQLLKDDGKPVAPPVKLRLPKAIEWRVVLGPTGELVVLWHSGVNRNGRFVDLGYAAQRFDALGRPASKAFAVLPGRGRNDFRRDLVVAALGADGTLAVAASVDDEPFVLGPGRVTLRTFDGAGHLLGGPFPVTSAVRNPNEISYATSLAAAPDGRVLLVWAQHPDPHRPEAHARVFNREAEPEGGTFQLHSQNNPERFFECANAAWAGDAWAVTWIGKSGSDFDHPPVTKSIYVRLFAGE